MEPESPPPPIRDLLVAPPSPPRITIVFNDDGSAKVYGDLEEVRKWCRRCFRDFTMAVLPGEGRLIQVDRQGRIER